MTGSAHTVVLAAGGTGGHIFPAEALAEELIAMGIRTALVTDRRFKSYGAAFANTEIKTIRAGTMGRGLAGKVTGVVDICVGLVQARSLLKELRPIAVVGFGGYPSFPTVRAAVMLGIPAIIHEQNSVLGRANRMLAGKASAIATSFANTRRIDPKDEKKTSCVGNPVRAAIRALHSIPYPEIADGGTIRVLITGGSQGASVFGQVLPAAFATLPQSLRQRLRIDQQCRADDIEVVKAAYAALQMNADIAPFFTDIPARLAAAHLVIARSGASTICELAAAGRPSILVPLPTSMDNHQYHNATALEEAGGAWLMPQESFVASALAARLEPLLSLPGRLSQAAANAKRFGKINAAHDLAQLVLSKTHIGNTGMLESGNAGKSDIPSSNTLKQGQAA